MSKSEKGTYYPDISAEFEMARINCGVFERDGRKVTLKEFYPKGNPSAVSNVAAGRHSSEKLRGRIEAFTEKWYWDFDKKSINPEE